MLAEDQDRVASRTQLAELGVDRQIIARRVRAGLWATVGPHVVVLHTGPLSRRQQQWAAVLHAGPGAGIGGLTALEIADFPITCPEVHVLAPHGTTRRSLATPAVDIRVTESRALSAGVFGLRGSPPRIPMWLAILGAASRSASPQACRTVLAAAVQRRLTSPEVLYARAEVQPSLRRRRLILETLRDVGGGSESLPELEYLAGLRRFGMPEPTRQQAVPRPGGSYVLDADFDPWQVTVEINGTQHLSLAAKEHDDTRRTRLAIDGRLVVDIGSWTVRHDAVFAVLLTADALLARGWQPTPSVLHRLTVAAERHPTFTWTSRTVAS